MASRNGARTPTFYTVKEAALILRVTTSTLYLAIREDAFPAVRIRGRYIIPAAALDRLESEAAETGRVIDPARMAAEQRIARELSNRTS